MVKRLIGFSLAIFSVLILFSCSSKKKSDSSAGGAGGAGGKGARNRNMTLSVEGYVVKPSTVSESLEVPGNILPFESTELHPEVSGRVVSINIKEGSYVKKGSPLVKLFDGDLQAQLKKLQVQLSISQKTIERYGELLKIQGISQQEYDLA